MSESPSVPPPLEPEVRTRRLRLPPLLWLLPALTAAVAGWLVWDTLARRGPEITVTFRSAEGIEPGKTRVKYRDVEVGTVTRVRISADLRRVVVTARLVAGAERLLAPDTRFWVVRPRIGIGGVSGLTTLVSGAYIEVDPGRGEPVYRFEGLEEPPLIRSDEPGTRFVLEARALSGIDRGSPVYYRGIEVGQVLGYDLDPGGGRVRLHVFVRSPYDRFVRTTSRFWNASGLALGTGPEGFFLRLQSVQALLLGGIAFDTPEGPTTGEPAAPGSRFVLFEDEDAARESRYTEVARVRVEFASSVRGLAPGAPVEFRGIRIGRVAEVRLLFDPERARFRVPVTLEIQPRRFLGGSAPADGAPRLDIDLLRQLVRRGLRARLRTANLLTGEALVEFDLLPDTPPAELRLDGEVPVIPSAPTEFEAITGSLQEVLRKLADLPLEAMIEEVRAAAREVGTLARSPELAAALAAARRAAEDVAATARDVRGDAGPLLAALRRAADRTGRAADAAERAFRGFADLVGPGSRTRDDVIELVRELRAAARAIRLFAEYLERNPQALIRGKGP